MFYSIHAIACSTSNWCYLAMKNVATWFGIKAYNLCFNKKIKLFNTAGYVDSIFKYLKSHF